MTDVYIGLFNSRRGLPMTFLSYAQNFEDVMLWRALQHVTNGFYIDVGAHHPDADSVTRAFYDRGWRGVNVEPTAEYFGRLAAARVRDINLQVAIGEAPGRCSFFVIPGTGLSTTNAAVAQQHGKGGWDVKETDIEVVTLAEICARHAPPDVHFLKIDVEGGEQQVLGGANFASFRPWIVLVESTRPLSQEEAYQNWEPILTAADYRFVWFDGVNRFYLAGERYEELSPHFRVPPNVFDSFVQISDTGLVSRIEHAQAVARAAEARAAAAEAGLAAAEERAAAAETWAAAAEGRAAEARHMMDILRRRRSWSITKPLRWLFDRTINR